MTGAEAWQAFRMDAARWVIPQEVVNAESLSTIALLAYRRPPLRAMGWFRLAAWCRAKGIRGVPDYLQRRLLRLYGLEMLPSMSVGGGLYIAHPVGCVLVADSIGTNVTIMGGVTFGRTKDLRWPRIRDRAFIGAGATVLGGVVIGDHAQVGAGALVLRDVPAFHTVVGGARQLSWSETQ